MNVIFFVLFPYIAIFAPSLTKEKMVFTKKISYLLLAMFMALTAVNAQDVSWYDKLQYLKYTPRYFGPNAFSLPELQSGLIHNRWEAEVRGEYHVFEGDRTKDIYGRLYIPLVKNRVGFEVNYIFYEYYKMTQETANERNTAGTSWKEGAHGDMVVSFFYNVFQDSKLADVMLEAALSTASGNRLADARYTDAATYWFDVNMGRYLYKNADSTAFIRVQGLAGFYCWMTNSIVHRQNDAFLYAAGMSGGFKNLTVYADLAGFYGYLNEGDRPLVLRTKLNYEYRKNIISFRYKHGIHDYLYDTFSASYIRCF